MNKLINKRNLMIFGVIIIVLISILIIFKYKNNKNVVLENIKVEDTPSRKLYNSYKNKEITTNEYVLYSAYSLFEPNKLDKKYKSEVVDSAPELMQMLYNYGDEVSEDTKNYIYEKIQRKDLIIGKQSNEVSMSNSILPVSNKIADNEYYENTLDKYIISSNKNFVIWYTTTEGENQITEDHAKEIADKLEYFVSRYKEMYNLDFTWEKAYFEGMDETKYKEYLNKIAPNDAEAIFNAMPVYIAQITQKSNDESTVGAYYQGMLPNTTYEFNNDMENKKINIGLPIGPYILIDAGTLQVYNNFNQISPIFKIVAHELFHHYQYSKICEDGTYKYCEDNKLGDENFILETSANWSAFKVVSDTSSNSYISRYFNNINKKIDTINPYDTFPFLMNYETTVENGKSIILNALKDHNGDTLGYLNSQTDKMDLVMRNLAKNNLLNNYEYESYKMNKLGEDYSYIAREDVFENQNVEKFVEPMSINYFDTWEAKKYKISNLSSNDKSYLTIFVTEKENVTEKSVKNLKVIYSEKLVENAIVDLKDYSN